MKMNIFGSIEGGESFDLQIAVTILISHKKGILGSLNNVNSFLSIAIWDSINVLRDCHEIFCALVADSFEFLTEIILNIFSQLYEFFLGLLSEVLVDTGKSCI